MGLNREIALATLGGILLLAGFCHRLPRLAGRDALAAQAIHRGLGSRPLIAFFKWFWPLGTTPVTLAALVVLLVGDTRAGVAAAAGYGLALIVEKSLKQRLERPRPFKAVPGIDLRQPRRAEDPSFPSGDAMRAWFLAAVIPAVFALPWPCAGLAVLLALIVTVGRVALGAHYPLDAVGGAGLGLLAAGLSLLFR